MSKIVKQKLNKDEFVGHSEPRVRGSQAISATYGGVFKFVNLPGISRKFLKSEFVEYRAKSKK